MNTSAKIVIVIEGNLVHEWAEYDHNALEIDGTDLVNIIHETMGIPWNYGGPDGCQSSTPFGRVRITIEKV